jgi:hypothetical protein
VCAHYRTHLGFVFYSLHQSNEGVHKCNSCCKTDPPFEITTHFRDPRCAKSHNLCVFFEKNKLAFKLVDPFNCAHSSEEALQEYHEQGPVIRLHGHKIKVAHIVELISKGVLMSVVNKTRCFKCQAKSFGEVYCAKCSPQS